MKIRVELKDDLTKYHKDLVIGRQGYAIGKYGVYSRSSDNFITVEFDNSITLDVLWRGLEIIDKEYLKAQSEERAKEKIELKVAKDIILTKGSLGALKSLSFKYSNICIGTYFKEDIQRYLNIFKEYNLDIQTIKEKSTTELK